MPLYPPTEAMAFKSRTHTNLVVSEGTYVPETFLIDRDLLPMFTYPYGGAGNVVIPKGLAVALMGEQLYDANDKVYREGLTIANGSNSPLGLAHHSLYETMPDAFPTGSNLPLVVNRQYVELPLLSAANKVYSGGTVSTDPADILMKWGCAYPNTLSAGDFVKPDGAGRLIKWNANKTVSAETVETFTASGTTQVIYPNWPVMVGTVTVTDAGSGDATGVTATVLGAGAIKLAGLTNTNNYTDLKITYTSLMSDNEDQKLGKILAVDTNMPPTGWLKYFVMDDVFRAYQEQRDILPTDRSYDADYKKAEERKYERMWMGIPYLTDGRMSSKTAVTGETLDTLGTLNEDTVVVLTTAHKPISDTDTLTVKINSSAVRAGARYKVDYALGKIYLYATPADSGHAVTIDYTHLESQVPGIPTAWDWAGSVGAVRILLLK